MLTYIISYIYIWFFISDLATYAYYTTKAASIFDDLFDTK